MKKPGRRGASGERIVRRLRPFASRILPLRPMWSSLGGMTRKRLRDPVRFHGSYGGLGIGCPQMSMIVSL